MSAHDTDVAATTAGRRTELFGPDLSQLPTLQQHLDLLEEALGDPERYAREWIAVQAEMSSGDREGGGAQLMWMPRDADDASPTLYQGWVACDDFEQERRERADAVSDHMPEDPAYREAIVLELMLLGRFRDNRPVSANEADAALEAFIAMGGRIMLNPQGQLSSIYPIDDDHAVERLEAKAAVARAFTRVKRRWAGRRHLTDAVRSRGVPTSGGWLVLEARHG